MQIIDLLVKLLQFPLDGAMDESNLSQVKIIEMYRTSLLEKKDILSMKYIQD